MFLLHRINQLIHTMYTSSSLWTARMTEEFWKDGAVSHKIALCL